VVSVNDKPEFDPHTNLSFIFHIMLEIGVGV